MGVHYSLLGVPVRVHHPFTEPAGATTIESETGQCAEPQILVACPLKQNRVVRCISRPNQPGPRVLT